MKLKLINNKKIVIVILFGCIFCLFLFTDSLQSAKFNKEHFIYGTAHYSDGESATGARVIITSIHGTLETYVSSEGWKVNCGDPGPNWPQGTNFTVYVDGCCGHNSWCGKEKGTIEGSETDMGDILVHPNQPPSSPKIVIDTPYIQINTPMTFRFRSLDPDEIHDVSYRIDWDANGSHNYTSFSSLFSYGESFICNHSWKEPGSYQISAIAKDEHGLLSNWSKPQNVTVYVTNDPPTITKVNAPKEIIIDQYCQLNVSSFDDTNKIQYFIDWGDDQTSNWTDFYDSNITISFNHSWKQKGDYIINITVRDLYGLINTSSFNIHVIEFPIHLIPLENSFCYIKTTIKNDGNISTGQGNYSIFIDGDGKIYGSVTTRNFPSIQPNQTLEISSDFIFGFSKQITITIDIHFKELDSLSYSTAGSLFFGFIIIS